ncbi:MAG TPA: hypothetical protein GXX23_01700 [Firmicutes bacterium]|nr:hypothetical protein [Candidatus Fermentithermobacillaceae bacterium]
MKIIPGNIFGFWLFVVASAVIVYVMNLSEKGKLKVTLRPIAGLDALEEAVGRATEMGRPVHFSPGLGDIIGTSAPDTLAALQILSYVTDLSAKYDARLLVTIRMPNVFPLAQELVRTAYSMANKPQSYKEDTVRYVSSDQDAYAAGVIGLMHQEKVASSILAGLYMGEALLIAESGASLGTMQVAITASITQIPFFVAACDYTIIGEELYAAGAYVSGNKARLGAIAGQDCIKLAVMAIIVLGTIVTSLGSNFVQDLLTK